MGDILAPERSRSVRRSAAACDYDAEMETSP